MVRPSISKVGKVPDAGSAAWQPRRGAAAAVTVPTQAGRCPLRLALISKVGCAKKKYEEYAKHYAKYVISSEYDIFDRILSRDMQNM